MNKMNVLVLNPPSKVTKNIVRDLIYGCWCKGKRIGGAKTPPLNLLYIATVLKNSNHKVTFIDAVAEQKGLDEIIKIIKNYDIVIVSTSSMSFREDAEVLQDLKNVNPRLKTIIFGSHPTFMPDACFEKSVDILIRREPEFIIRDVVDAFGKGDNSWKKIKGIGFQEKGEKRLNEIYPFIENLDELPFPDRAMLPKDVDYFNPIVRRLPYATVMTSRGCPAKCTFCSVGPFFGQTTRYRSAKNVLDELEILKKQGFKEIWFRDETFTVYKKRNTEICNEMIKRNMNFSWIANARVGSIDKDMMALMQKAGCHLIKFGVESGVQEILNNIKKGIKAEKTRETFKWAHELGLDTHAHMMLGCPGETKETIKRTIKFAKEIDPTTVTFGICTPYPGTELFKDVFEKHPEIGDGSSCDLTKIHTSGYFNRYFTELSEKELEDSLKYAYRSFYLRPSYFIKSIRSIRSVDDIKRLILAGTNVLQFSVE